MNEETISKVLTGETDIAKMSHDDFVKMLKCLDRMYFSRVMNCVDGMGRFDKEWTALSCIFRRVVEAITEKTSGNSAATATTEKSSVVGDAAKLREALEGLTDGICFHCDMSGDCKGVPCEKMQKAKAALAKPPRQCDVGTAEEQSERYYEFCYIHNCRSDCPLFKADSCEIAWAQMPYESEASHGNA